MLRSLAYTVKEPLPLVVIFTLFTCLPLKRGTFTLSKIEAPRRALYEIRMKPTLWRERTCLNHHTVLELFEVSDLYDLAYANIIKQM